MNHHPEAGCNIESEQLGTKFQKILFSSWQNYIPTTRDMYKNMVEVDIAISSSSQNLKVAFKIVSKQYCTHIPVIGNSYYRFYVTCYISIYKLWHYVYCYVYILNFTYWASVATKRQQMVKHRIIFMIISRQYKYLGAEWVREFKKTVTRTKKNGFLACLLLTVLLLHAGCVQAAAAVIFSRGRCQARRGGVGLGMDQDIKTIEFDCLRGNVNKYGKIIENKISHLNPYFSGIYMEPSLCATQNTQNERFIPVWLTRT